MSAGKAAAAAVAGLMSLILGVVLLGAGGDAAVASGAGIGALDSGPIPNGWAPWVARAGSICPEIPGPIIAAQIEAESNWNRSAVSPAGAVGLSQFMPGTWISVGRDDDGNGIGSPYDPGDAIMAQGRYDCQIVEQLRGKVAGDLTELALAGYNAGPAAVLQYGSIPPYPETQAYVPRIMGLATKYSLHITGGPTSGQVADVIAVARKYLGTPYAFGGGSKFGPGPGWFTGTTGWDCSSYMQFVHWQGAHVDMPRTAKEQSTAGQAVPRDQLQPGDIVVFSDHDWGHVGLYIGNGQMIHEPNTGDVAKVTTIVGVPFWESQTWKIRRYL
jgi:cell wall-associated NlpC family hydrolase